MNLIHVGLHALADAIAGGYLPQLKVLRIRQVSLAFMMLWLSHSYTPSLSRLEPVPTPWKAYSRH